MIQMLAICSIRLLRNSLIYICGLIHRIVEIISFVMFDITATWWLVQLYYIKVYMYFTVFEWVCFLGCGIEMSNLTSQSICNSWLLQMRAPACVKPLAYRWQYNCIKLNNMDKGVVAPIMYNTVLSIIINNTLTTVFGHFCSSPIVKVFYIYMYL